jgi:AcrR family transcriptional regulator
MRALGVQMGVDPTAVYRHFPTKEELMGAMCDIVLGQALEYPSSSTEAHHKTATSLAVTEHSNYDEWELRLNF